jgi:chorismate mutase
MRNADIRRLDRAIQATTKKLEAVRRGEWWPLTPRERAAMTRALVGGGYRVVRGRSAGRAEQRMESTGNAAEARLTAELTALHAERQRLITEAARAKATNKSSRWW